ncbi:MAG: FliH/SctL family protein [Oligoflexus sp.]
MKNRTSLKLKGRFFKADDPTTKIIDVVDFDLMEICDYPISLPDNPQANIFHSKLHEKSEIDQVIGTSKLVNTVFEVSDARPVIKPLDFTQEWRRIRRRMTERQNRGDDDDMDFEQEGFSMSLQRKVKDAIQEMKKTSGEVEASPTTEAEEKQQVVSEESSSPATAESKEYEASQFDQDVHSSEELSTSSESSAEPQKNPFHFSNQHDAEIPHHETKNMNNDEFIPMHQGKNNSAPQKPEIEPVSEEEREAIIQEAQSKGYEEGFRLGEEKALLSVQDKIQQTIQEVQNIVGELEGLKSNILHNAQENFQVLCQALMESLLHQQFAINPASFQTVVQRAIDEAVPDDSFTIHVSPKAFDNLKDVADEKFLSRLKVDQDLKQHDFKIESNLTVVDGNISQIISDLLEEADTKLFDTPEKVG